MSPGPPACHGDGGPAHAAKSAYQNRGTGRAGEEVTHGGGMMAKPLLPDALWDEIAPLRRSHRSPRAAGRGCRIGRA